MATWRILALGLALVLAVALLPAPVAANRAPVAGFEFDGCVLLTVEEVSAYASTEVSQARQLRIREDQIASCEFVLGEGPYGSGGGMHVVVEAVPPGELATHPFFADLPNMRLDPVDVGDEGYVAISEFLLGGEVHSEDVFGLSGRVGDTGFMIGGTVGAALPPLDRLEPDSATAEALLQLGRKVAARLPDALAGRGGGGPGGGSGAGGGDGDAEDDPTACEGFAGEFRGPRVFVQGYEVTVEVVGEAYGGPHEQFTDWGAGTALAAQERLTGQVLTLRVDYPEEPGIYDGVHTVRAERDGETCTASLPFTVELAQECVEVAALLDGRGYRFVLGATDEPRWGNAELFGTDPLVLWRERESFTGTDRVAAILAPAPDPDFELGYVDFDGTPVPANRHPGRAQDSGWAVASFAFPDQSATTGGQVVTQHARVAARLEIPPPAVLRLVGAAGGEGLSSAPTCHYTVETTVEVHHQPWLWQCFEQLGPCRLARRTDAGARWGEVQAVASYLQDLDDITSLIPPTPVTGPADILEWVAMEALRANLDTPGFEVDRDVAPLYCIGTTREWLPETPPC